MQTETLHSHRRNYGRPPASLMKLTRQPPLHKASTEEVIIPQWLARKLLSQGSKPRSES